MSPELHPREARLAAKQKVDAALTEARTQLAKLRCERDAMVIALRKGELRGMMQKWRLVFCLLG
jgi:hypothetical protein